MAYTIVEKRIANISLAKRRQNIRNIRNIRNTRKGNQYSVHLSPTYVCYQSLNILIDINLALISELILTLV